MRAFGAALLGMALALPAGARDLNRPAELPPAGYGGQQYVDSKGCMFMRAGSGGKVVWIPRVSREGVPICGNPPSGRRVPVVEEVGVQPVPDAGASGATTAGDDIAGTGADTSGNAGAFFVAVGSFGVPANAERAETMLVKLNYGVVRGSVQGATSTLITVFAGPFADGATAVTARDALREAGFPDASVIQP